MSKCVGLGESKLVLTNINYITRIFHLQYHTLLDGLVIVVCVVVGTSVSEYVVRSFELACDENSLQRLRNPLPVELLKQLNRTMPALQLHARKLKPVLHWTATRYAIEDGAVVAYLTVSNSTGRTEEVFMNNEALLKFSVTASLSQRASPAPSKNTGPTLEMNVPGSTRYSAKPPVGMCIIHAHPTGGANELQYFGVLSRISHCGRTYAVMAFHTYEMLQQRVAQGDRIFVRVLKGNAVEDVAVPLASFATTGFSRGLDVISFKAPDEFWAKTAVKAVKPSYRTTTSQTVSVYTPTSSGMWTNAVGTVHSATKMPFQFKHSASTDYGASGGLVLSGSTVIGLHCGRMPHESLNYATSVASLFPKLLESAEHHHDNLFAYEEPEEEQDDERKLNYDDLGSDWLNFREISRDENDDVYGEIEITLGGNKARWRAYVEGGRQRLSEEDQNIRHHLEDILSGRMTAASTEGQEWMDNLVANFAMSDTSLRFESNKKPLNPKGVVCPPPTKVVQTQVKASATGNVSAGCAKSSSVSQPEIISKAGPANTNPTQSKQTVTTSTSATSFKDPLAQKKPPKVKTMPVQTPKPPTPELPKKVTPSSDVKELSLKEPAILAVLESLQRSVAQLTAQMLQSQPVSQSVVTSGNQECSLAPMQSSATPNAVSSVVAGPKRNKRPQKKKKKLKASVTGANQTSATGPPGVPSTIKPKTESLGANPISQSSTPSSNGPRTIIPAPDPQMVSALASLMRKLLNEGAGGS